MATTKSSAKSPATEIPEGARLGIIIGVLKAGLHDCGCGIGDALSEADNLRQLAKKLKVPFAALNCIVQTSGMNIDDLCELAAYSDTHGLDLFGEGWTVLR